MTGEDHRLVIRLEEGIRFSRELATPVARMLAIFVDTTLILVLGFLAARVAMILAPLSMDIGMALYYWAGFVFSFGYYLLLELRWNGQTIGKKMMRLRVVDATGLRLRFHQILIRNLIRLLDLLPAFYLLGGIVAFSSKKFQRLGDIAANTVVIRLPRQVLPDLEQIRGGKYNSLLDHPHIAARLRQQIEPAMAGCLLEMVMRSDEFTSEARIELFAEAAEWIEDQVRIPEETLDLMSHEQLVRNVVDVLFTKRDRARRQTAIS